MLLAVVGAAVLVLARRRRGPVALGGYLLVQGLYWAGQNLFRGNAEAGVVWSPVSVLLRVALVVGVTALVFSWPIALRPNERRFAAASLTVGAMVFVLLLTKIAMPGGWEAIRTGDNVPTPHMFWTQAHFVLNQMSVGLSVAFALLLPLRFIASGIEENSLRVRLAWTAIVLFFGVLDGGESFVRGTEVSGWPDALPGIVIVAGMTILWLASTRRPQGHLARNVVLVRLALTLVGMALATFWPFKAVDDTANGVLRCAYAFLLAFAIARVGLLGYDLQVRVAKRGTLAAGALATLFIVAQVMQNFLSAEYGLLTGGVIAGAVLFAASPIQRAMEAKSSRRPAEQAPAIATPVARREQTYRNALRLAMRDRKLTAEEEAHLFELAEDLGIGAGRAFQLKREIEGEVAV